MQAITVNGAYIHLLLNHLPVIGAVFGILLLGAATLRRSDELSRAAFSLYILLGVAALVAYLTGEPAEDHVENVVGVSRAMIEQHEEAALVASVVTGAAAALALLAMIAFRRSPIPRWTQRLGLGVAVVIAALMAYTADLGGQIRHSEIRSALAPQAGGAAVRDNTERHSEEEHVNVQ